MKTVAWNKATGRYEIREVNGEGDDRTLGAVLYTFPAGTTNNQACAAYDEYLRTGRLPA